MPVSGPHTDAHGHLHPHKHCAHTHENTHTYIQTTHTDKIKEKWSTKKMIF